MNRSILLQSRPEGKPTSKNFEFREEADPEIKDGELLLRSTYISVDPYLRGRMRDEESYIEAFKVGKPIESMVVAEVLESKNHHFQKGEFVNGMLQWKELQVSNGHGLNKSDKNLAPLPAYLGVLGLTGLTAYLALEKIGKLQKGETLVVSGAAGAVGSVAGQIGKIKGCRVVGTAGSDEKTNLLTEKYGFDSGINYKTTEDIKEAIAKVCPDGVDVYFDNVGGEILDAVLLNINKDARIINCGAISLYNETSIPTGPRPEGILIKKTALMQGFLIRDHAKDFGQSIRQLGEWVGEKKIKYDETILEGFEKLPEAFIGLFEGKNVGKMLVKI